jgi:copper transport protein
MRVLTAIAAILLLALWHVVLAMPACAHATLVSSEPVDGAVIAAAPSRMTLTFNEPVAPLILRLAAADGVSTVLQATVEREASLALSLPPGLGEGTHVLSWRVVSLDGHPIGGTVVFSVGTPSTRPQLPAKSTANLVVITALWTLKVVFYIGLFIGIGGSFFLAWLAPNLVGGSRTAITAALAAGLVAAPLLVGLQGADALELPLSGLASRIVWKAGLETSFGATAIAAACALFAALFALEAQATKVARGLSLIGIATAGLALAVSGHASAAAPQWLTRPAVFVHTISLAFWIGALVPLGTSMFRETAPEAVLVQFSRAIPWAVAALIASGTVLAIVQVANASALLTTAYGLLLCAKLGLVAVLLALAAWNRRSLTPAVIGGSKEARRNLARSIATELGIVFAILGLVGAWRFTPPPRALAIAAARPAHVHLHTATAMADITFEPGRPSIVQASIVIMTGDFGPLDAKEVRLSVENSAAGIETISRQAVKGSDAVWRIQQLPIPAGGRWTIQVEILINDFEKITLVDQIDIRGPE